MQYLNHGVIMLRYISVLCLTNKKVVSGPNINLPLYCQTSALFQPPEAQTENISTQAEPLETTPVSSGPMKTDKTAHAKRQAPKLIKE
jgi:hypothetical protein